jgi:hypothetical protein
MTDISDYRQEMERKLNALNTKIEELKSKVDVIGEHKTKDFYKHLEEFNAQQEELKTQLQKLDTLESEAQAEQKRYLEETFQNLSKNMEIRLAPYVEEK